MTVEKALEFARLHFPKGPEELAKHLKIEVRYSALGGCDGWCLTSGQKTLIRINNCRARSSQRFTLAHELSHLLLGIPSVVGETIEDMLSSDSFEERRVNQTASELLIPAQEVTKRIGAPPVIAKALERLAKAANVSQVMAACRVANLAQQIGLVNAAVVQFEDDRIKWKWSTTIQISAETPIDLRNQAGAAKPNAFRHQQADGDVIIASLIDNPQFQTSTLFVQLLPPEHGLARSPDERRLELEAELFANNSGLRTQVQGCFGAFKPTIEGHTLKQAEAAFWDRYRARFENTSINSKAGREYVRLRMAEWCS
jgi:Zn-dependent peptidase ImmA (M78 family)